MRHGTFPRMKFESLADYRREEEEKARRKAFIEQISNGMTEEEKEADRKERQPTSKFNGKSFSFAYYANYRKGARKAAYELNNQGYSTKISKHSNNPNKKGKPYFIVWKR